MVVNPRSSSFLLALAPVAAAAVLAGCGSGGSDQAAGGLPRDVASRLARQSEAAAQSLDRGDPCAAARRAKTLSAQVERAITDGRIPAALAGEVRRRAVRLADSIVCVETPTEQLPANAGRGNGDHRDEQHQGEGDD